MTGQTAIVIGATGLTGGFLVNELLQDDYFSVVRILLRKQLNMIHPKLQQLIVNFDDINNYTNNFGRGDIIFCSIGTTQRKVKGDKVAYKNIDHGIPVNAARIGNTLGYKKFLIVSSVGADSSSSNFYLRLKGQTEDDIQQSAPGSISFFRPSMLLGNRKESRPFEKVIQGITKFISLFLFGSLKKYHSIEAKEVAKAMIAQSKLNKPGINILEYKEMIELTR